MTLFKLTLVKISAFYHIINRRCTPIFLLLYAATCCAHNSCAQLLHVNIHKTTSQILVVRTLKGIDAKLTACERRGATWRPAMKTVPVVIGANGLARPGEKKEGDKKSPFGLFPLGEAFGFRPRSLHMDYRYITKEDKYIDDPDSPAYNTWVVGETSAKSFEKMYRPPYEMGVVVDYNKNPTVPHAGSGIFIHLWKTPHSPTKGCVAMSRTSLNRLFSWLDKKRRPAIYLYT